MKKLAILSILIMGMPTANAADRSDPTPAPVVSAVPTPAKTTPTPVASATPTPSVAAKNVNTELTKVRTLIEAKNFSAALTALQAADKTFPNNADINNLLGYSARNLKQYKPAATYYAKALKIDPKHLGALEYQGELFMLTKKTSDAKKNLAKLKSLCGVNCEEYIDLKKAIGNK
ncbi:Tetratricopeptide repeat-containing protein [Candidatus Nanopelagicus limnes]|jgi:tetratricopeptide (TPR) repeat protein|uniref:Tetratricopeptide repeat-containing protein n=1 Tax=Candidatus Nanopelagicus limnae TaxID=1884634 RepID=A0A249JX94_9ACTN|nr:tetratricopeptide repeat protein [Candidatus Nanopelagicus limnes]ASY09143.1 Tetratricopeptide repeat-containing protein [Candidatus Nanopelagicus limnes]